MKRLTAKGVVRGLAAAMAAAAAVSAWAAPAVGEGELLFMSNRRGNVFEYYRMAADGSRVLRLLAEDGEVGDLTASRRTGSACSTPARRAAACTTST